MAKKTVCIVIPAYNEAGNIAQVLYQVWSPPYSVDRAIVVDDGSTDNTSKVAKYSKSTVLRHEKNLGKGAALRTGFGQALKDGCDIIVTIDGDGQHDPKEIPLLLEPILNGSADVVNGSRMKSEMPAHRKIVNTVLNGMTKQAAKTTDFIRDSQSGFRAYTREALQKIDFQSNGMGVDSELISAAYRAGLRVNEVDITVKYEGTNHTHNAVRHTVDVSLSVFADVALKNPLRYLSIPGAISLAIGFVLTFLLIGDYLTKGHYFSVPLSLLSILICIFGLVLFLTGLILHAINVTVKKFVNAKA